MSVSHDRVDDLADKPVDIWTSLESSRGVQIACNGVVRVGCWNCGRMRTTGSSKFCSSACVDGFFIDDVPDEGYFMLYEARGDEQLVLKSHIGLKFEFIVQETIKF